MQFYLAPMEGLTGYVYRSAYHKYFPAADRYFTPFITNKKMSSRERNDILPEHNEGMTVLPQILTNQAEDFLSLTKELKEYGYDTVNLNLGCPSGTVVAKRRGSGLLAWPHTLDAFLDEIFSSCDCRISIKTRLGTTDTDEWETLLAIYDKYPLEELIPAAKKMAAGIAAQAPIAVRNCKKAINEGLQVDMDQAIVIEEKLFGDCFETEDQKAGMGNFLAPKDQKVKVVPFKNC